MTQERIDDAALHQEMEQRYLAYALSTIVSRALPDVRDGLKPVHRRIIYAMDAIGLNETKRHVKSARVVGEVIGKYHPHGDAAVYDAMVRMAQDFSLRYPLVDGQGNFGSIDGDNAAAMRYTEAKLSPIAAELLADMKKETVQFKSNYDATLTEPAVLPARIPNLLINGAAGIAVGMSTNIPPHNLTEVVSALLALIDNQEMTTRELCVFIKAPDFPTNGEIHVQPEAMTEIYRTGHGGVKVRGEFSLEEMKRGKKNLIITSIPYSVNKSRLIERIANLITTKKLPLVTDIRDESTTDIRIVMELRTGLVDPEKVKAYLLHHTEMEVNFPINFVCLTPEGVPERLSLKEILRYFLDFRKEVTVRKLTYEANRLRERLHILKGLLIIFDGLDKAIAIIRASETRPKAVEGLGREFGLDQIQADAVLEIRLHSLVRLERDKLLLEFNEKTARFNEVTAILADQGRIWGVVKDELKEVMAKYGDRRLTKVVREQEVIKITQEDFIVHEDVTVVVSINGWVRKFKTYDPKAIRFKEGDAHLVTVSLNTRDNICFFTNLGRVYVTRAYDLPASGKGFGEPLQTIYSFADGEHVVSVLVYSREAGPEPDPEDQLIESDDGLDPEISPENGESAGPDEISSSRVVSLLRDAPVESNRRQLSLFSVKSDSVAETEEGEKEADLETEAEELESVPTSPEPAADRPELPTGATWLVLTQGGKGFRFERDWLKEPTNKNGRQVIRLKDNDRVFSVITADYDLVLTATSKKVLIIKLDEVPVYSGPGAGVNLVSVSKYPPVLAATVSTGHRFMIYPEKGEPFVVKVKDHPVMGRGAQGKGFQSVTIKGVEIIKESPDHVN
ncbi:MAG: DNA topoisomerase IV subunit A [Deltaproteobacteria bacterium]|nr:DNA topoisomerase IV subunit A [Deltaproteobacteria bacterium]